ncbi:3-oxoacyl-reductase [Ilyonectria robusta]|uniref:3-oxoacyl-reductase n=1 Tax=Ilyonectria robusta TaxID=1079257 RepID=UPI001E8CBC0A|nr:3-oxoacyl-reductase [Ilyonectria robusta]KAH8729967.1 3-oxoacyl-reductase [Ilyonectria robusta]
MSNLASKVITITGAASGIGLATAKRLVSLGARVSLADIDGKNLALAAKDLIDIHGPDNIHSSRRSISKFGQFNGAANLVGVNSKQTYKSPITDIDDEDWDFVMNVNLKGVLNCLRAQIPAMEDGGAVVNAASIASLLGFANAAAYVSSKHAVIGLTRTAAKEVGHRGIRVNAICPGAINTPLLHAVTDNVGVGFQAPRVALGREGEPAEIAALVTFLLNDESRYITGSCYGIDGGWAC